MPSQPVPNDEQGDDGFIDMDFFYISFGVCYTIVVMTIATILYTSIHIGDAGCCTSSKTASILTTILWWLGFATSPTSEGEFVTGEMVVPTCYWVLNLYCTVSKLSLSI